ncbi:hypothetical protein HanPSC8_Chr05g0191391 [Helianthus annuus]|nr:hypothetical protein HanPSC8_Chr05g0191391 [Helianthus annuus]
MAIPIPTPIGLEIPMAKEYATVNKNGLFGINLRRAIPIAIAANILCKEIVPCRRQHESKRVCFFSQITKCFIRIAQEMHERRP